MPRAVIAYDKNLPEIPGRRPPWEKSTSFLVKDDAALAQSTAYPLVRAIERVMNRGPVLAKFQLPDCC